MLGVEVADPGLFSQREVGSEVIFDMCQRGLEGFL